MQDLVSLFNQALTAVGHPADVTDAEANTKSANLCRLWYAPARRAVLSAAYWPSVRNLASLAVYSAREFGTDWTAGQPWPGNTIAFRLPLGCLRPQYLANFTRFSVGAVNSTKLLFAEADSALLYYTKDEDKPDLWEADLYEAVVYSLAARMNMAKSGKIQITNQLRADVDRLIRSATARIANEEDTYYESIPAHYAEAGYSLPYAARYYYPTTSYNLGAA